MKMAESRLQFHRNPGRVVKKPKKNKLDSLDLPGLTGEKLSKLMGASKEVAHIRRKIEKYLELLDLCKDLTEISPFHNIFTKYGLVRPRLYKRIDLKKTKEAFLKIVL